jgi:hypothetical protein
MPVRIGARPRPGLRFVFLVMTITHERDATGLVSCEQCRAVVPAAHSWTAGWWATPISNLTNLNLPDIAGRAPHSAVDQARLEPHARSTARGRARPTQNGPVRVLEGRHFLHYSTAHAIATSIIIDTEVASSFLWFAAIQGIEGKQDLANLTPKGCFIAAEAVEGEVGEIG